MIKLAISGCKGKMGQRIFDLACADNGFKVEVLLERKDHPDIGAELNGMVITAEVDKIKQADVLIEFTTPQASLEHLKACERFNIPMVIGTTGLSSDQQKEIRKSSTQIPIVFAANMSVGVNVLFKLVQEAASKLSSAYKVKIKETHHVHKKDSPSGTAKQLATIIQEYGRQELKEIESIREDEIVGEHEVYFESQDDLIKLSHSAKSRDIFAKGALEAAKFIVKKKRGLFNMQNILETE